MANKLVRYQKTGDIHFVTFSCYQQRTHFSSPESRNLFEQSLEKMRTRYEFCVFGYVVMPDHVHLLLSEPKKVVLSKAIQALKISVAVQRIEQPFWEARYYDFNVFTDTKRIEKLKYIHRNPVTRGLVSKPEQWQSSSFRHHLTGEIGLVEIESWRTAARRESAIAFLTHHGSPALKTPDLNIASHKYRIKSQ